MRLFFAAEFPPETRRALADLGRQLKFSLPEARFTREEHIHLTLYFVGEATTPQADALASLLRGLETPEPFTLRAGQLGTFRSGGGLHTLWIGLEAHPSLLSLRDSLTGRLQSAGYPATRFTPHVTLAREVLMDGPVAVFADPPLEMPVCSVTLFESLRRDGRLIYRPHAVKKMGE